MPKQWDRRVFDLVVEFQAVFRFPGDVPRRTPPATWEGAARLPLPADWMLLYKAPQASGRGRLPGHRINRPNMNLASLAIAICSRKPLHFGRPSL